MRESPCAQEKDELEPLLRLRVGLVLDEHDAAPLPDCLARVAKDSDEVVHELRRSQSDFLRHPPLIASGAGPQHSPKAGPGYLSGRVPKTLKRMRGAPGRSPRGLLQVDNYFFSLKKASSVEPSANVAQAR